MPLQMRTLLHSRILYFASPASKTLLSMFRLSGWAIGTWKVKCITTRAVSTQSAVDRRTLLVQIGGGISPACSYFTQTIIAHLHWCLQEIYAFLLAAKIQVLI
jgi:hypothetical protein